MSAKLILVGRGFVRRYIAEHEGVSGAKLEHKTVVMLRRFDARFGPYYSKRQRERYAHAERLYNLVDVLQYLRWFYEERPQLEATVKKPSWKRRREDGGL